MPSAINHAWYVHMYVRPSSMSSWTYEASLYRDLGWSLHLHTVSFTHCTVKRAPFCHRQTHGSLTWWSDSFPKRESQVCVSHSMSDNAHTTVSSADNKRSSDLDSLRSTSFIFLIVARRLSLTCTTKATVDLLSADWTRLLNRINFLFIPCKVRIVVRIRRAIHANVSGNTSWLVVLILCMHHIIMLHCMLYYYVT